MQGIPHDSNDVAIFKSTIALTHSLGPTLVAEGAETEAQLAFLRENNGGAYQGWRFAKALTVEAMTALLPQAAPARD
jgi:EAL domain-containing protein (putative c-di-GMP-specific phosphodiesterase class I)